MAIGKTTVPAIARVLLESSVLIRLLQGNPAGAFGLITQKPEPSKLDSLQTPITCFPELTSFSW
jgi:hypothetical protein